MFNKKGPYIILIMLVIVLFFILGFRAGQGVEKTNKMIDLLISQPPSATPAPTSRPAGFKTYLSKGCMISFMYPDYLQIKTESTKSALLFNQNQILAFSCEPTATSSSDFIDVTVLTKLHPQTNNKIYFYIDKSLQTLLEKTLEFPSK